MIEKPDEYMTNVSEPAITVIGGGTGLSTMLRGLKHYSHRLTAIVAVSDDGGGSGILRNDLGMLPPGDIRNCILSLANTEPLMERLLQYRFTEGMLKGQSFGNLFLAAMSGICNNFLEAVTRMSDVLAVTGRVLPVSLDDINIYACLEDGFEICGESNISKHNDIHPGKIKRVWLRPENPRPLDEAVEAILEADAVVLGPGSLYTSILPNLLVKGIKEALSKTRAPRIYVCNVMTQPGETDGFTVKDHIRVLEEHSFEGLVEYCIVNAAPIEGAGGELLNRYLIDGAEFVVHDRLEMTDFDKINYICGNFAKVKNDYIRHDALKLAEAVMNCIGKT